MTIVHTKDLTSLGAKKLKSGRYLRTTTTNGRKTLEIIEGNIKEIGEIIEKGTDLFKRIEEVLFGLFGRLPCSIIVDDVEYIKTEQIARGQAPDKIWYQSERLKTSSDTSSRYSTARMYEFEALTIGKARKMAREALEADEYL
jgi:hypothetical protein